MTEANFQLEVGRLLCGAVRDMLESEQFAGRKIRFREGKGLFSRTFSVIGDETDVRSLEQRIRHYMIVNGYN